MRLLIKIKKIEKKSNNINFKESLSSIVYDYTDLIAILSHINSQVEQNRTDNIAFTLERQYHCLGKNVSSDSKKTFGDDVKKRIATITITNFSKLHQKIKFFLG